MDWCTVVVQVTFQGRTENRIFDFETDFRRDAVTKAKTACETAGLTFRRIVSVVRR